MKPHKQIGEILWNGLRIEARFTPNFSPIYEETYGYRLVHIELCTLEPPLAPLPISDTGYRSHFIPSPQLADYEDHLEYLLAWLDHAATDPQWIAQAEAAKQGSLF